MNRTAVASAPLPRIEAGWGSLTLWMAERYPGARITAVSNSRPQREYIEAQCRKRALFNVQVITQDVNRLELPAGRFDRCASIEMFEHMRNYETLLGRIAAWLRPGGKLFVHIFAHKTLMYPFETEGDGQLDGPAFLHRRPDARIGHAALVPARRAARTPLARRRHAL